MNESVLLLHGLWMRPLIMQWLAGQLRQQGYQVYVPPYHSVSCTPRQNAQAVHTWLQQQSINSDTFHVIAHSLGGIVSMHLFDLYNNISSGKFITLGSPVLGSVVARRVAHWPVLNRFIGNSLVQGLSGHDMPAPPGRDWGMIAGNRPLGTGLILGGLSAPHDGLVAVAETLHPSLNAHIVLPVTHNGLLFSKSVLAEISLFLTQSRFSINEIDG